MPLAGWANFFVPLFHCRSYQGVFMQDNQSWINSYYVGVATVVLALGAIWRVSTLRSSTATGGRAAGTRLVAGRADGILSPPGVGRRNSGVWLVVPAGRCHWLDAFFPSKFVILPVFILPLLAAYNLAEKQPRPGTKPPDAVETRGLVWFAMVHWSWASVGGIGNPGHRAATGRLYYGTAWPARLSSRPLPVAGGLPKKIPH